MFIIAIITIFRSAISGNQSNEPSLKNWGPETKPLTSYTQCGKQCATGYPVPVLVPANPANIFQSGSGSGSGQILAGLAGFLKVIQKFSKMLKM